MFARLKSGLTTAVGAMCRPVFVLRCCAAILIVTGLAKGVSAFGGGRMLDLHDPIFGLRFRHLFPLVACVELLVAYCCLFGRMDNGARAALVWWLSTSFLTYRLGLRWVRWRRPCGCMGALTDALHVPPSVADDILKASLAFMLVGSCWVLYRAWRRQTGVASGRMDVAGESQAAGAPRCRPKA